MKDIKNAIAHLKEHQTYPATRAELVKTCNELTDFSDEDKKWFEDNLPEGSYSSEKDVFKALLKYAEKFFKVQIKVTKVYRKKK